MLVFHTHVFGVLILNDDDDDYDNIDDDGKWDFIPWLHVQGGPAKVRPTYIFDGNIWMHR